MVRLNEGIELPLNIINNFETSDSHVIRLLSIPDTLHLYPRQQVAISTLPSSVTADFADVQAATTVTYWVEWGKSATTYTATSGTTPTVVIGITEQYSKYTLTTTVALGSAAYTSFSTSPADPVVEELVGISIAAASSTHSSLSSYHRTSSKSSTIPSTTLPRSTTASIIRFP